MQGDRHDAQPRADVLVRRGRDQRLFVAVRQYLYALDAKPGTPVAGFGQAGRIDLRDGLGRTQKDMVSLSRIGRTHALFTYAPWPPAPAAP
jgi:hypothetical protein